MYYEDLFKPQTIERALAFVGLAMPVEPLIGASVKRNPTRLRDVISNFEAIAGEFDDEELAQLYSESL
ncbi:MAG: hypothetical protein GKR94_07540 [Gammaproteobacteria bacterium]|nr:hypothetical protein [Gammaproteobacteria bacterium]